MRLSETAMNEACRAVVRLVDRGSSAGEVRVLDASGNVLLCVPLAMPGFDAPDRGVAQARGLPLSARGERDGDAARFDVVDSNGAVAWSGTVSKAGAGGDMQLRDTHIQARQLVSITAFQHKQPGG